MNRIFYKILFFFRKPSGPFCIDEKDERNFGADVVVKITKEHLVDKNFIVFDPTPLDQYDSDFCVGFGGAYEAEGTEAQVSSGAYLFAMSKKLVGSWKGWGTSILNMCKARCKFGVCRKELWDYKKGLRDYYANWYNIPREAHEDAEKHKGQTYFEIERPAGWSMFDTIRAYLWALRDKKCLVHTGNNGHKITIIGYSKDRDCLVARDSYGLRTYDNGIRDISRNEAASLFTPYIIIDMPRTIADAMIKYKGKAIKLADNPDCYLVRGGTKNLLKNEMVALSYGIKFFNDVVTVEKEEFDFIPTGVPLKFDGGEFHQFVHRIVELIDPTKLDSLLNN